MKKILSFLLVLMLLFFTGCQFQMGGTQDPVDPDSGEETPNENEGTVYTITYELNGGTFLEEVIETYTSGEETTLPIPRKVSSIFNGWFEYDSSEPFDVIPSSYSGDVKVYAKWKQAEVYNDLTFHTNGGTLGTTAPTEYKEGQTTTLPTVSKPGYYFKGWFTEETFENRLFAITKSHMGDLDLYAKFEEISPENTYISFYGDSISTFYDPSSPINSAYNGTNQYYYPIYCPSVSSYEMTWWYQTIKNTNTNLLINNSISGSTAHGSSNTCGEHQDRINRLMKGKITPDIVIIYLGINDSGTYTVDTYSKSYRNMCEKIEATYPGVQIMICTLAYETYFSNGYRELYNEWLFEFAEEKDYPVIDFSKAWDATTEVKNDWYYLADNIHPNEKGMKVMSGIATDVLNAFFESQK